METKTERTFSAFAGHKCVVSGDVNATIAGVMRYLAKHEGENVLVFEDRTGKQIDFDLRGTVDEAIARLAEHPSFAAPKDEGPRGPGRPKLGVVSREISLLPRHWEWLESQPEGTSGALRRLVEEARRRGQGKQIARAAREAAGKAMWSLAGDLPHFEEASRALYARDQEKLTGLIKRWPKDVKAYVERLVAEAVRLEAIAAAEAGAPA